MGMLQLTLCKPRRHKGGIVVIVVVVVISALQAVSGQFQAPSALTRGTHLQGGWLSRKASATLWRNEKSLASAKIEPIFHGERTRSLAAMPTVLSRLLFTCRRV